MTSTKSQSMSGQADAGADAQPEERTWQFNALTDLWTGSVDGNDKRLITTGLIGSIRWWFEVFVRGLGGDACDPTVTKCEGRNHCVVCEIFGCTGWARKFRFTVLEKVGNIKTDQIKQDQPFSFRFTPLRPIRPEEWTLLDATLRLIAEYGAIGGRTVFKPTDEPHRESKPQHKDYGLVKMTTTQQIDGTNQADLKKYLFKWQQPNNGDFAWASLQYFWYVRGRYLSRQDKLNSAFNQVLGREGAKKKRQFSADPNDEISKWLAGTQGKSKKVFSFREPARTFGFVKPELFDFKTMKQRLKKAWGQNGWAFLTGGEIINQLFAGKEDRH